MGVRNYRLCRRKQPSPKGNALVNKTKVLYRPRSLKREMIAEKAYVDCRWSHLRDCNTFPAVQTHAWLLIKFLRWRRRREDSVRYDDLEKSVTRNLI